MCAERFTGVGAIARNFFECFMFARHQKALAAQACPVGRTVEVLDAYAPDRSKLSGTDINLLTTRQ